jgi:hypothetical protein
VPENSPGEAGVFDAHADLLYTVVREHVLGNDRSIEDRFLPGMRAGGADVRVAPIYLGAHIWAQVIGGLLITAGLVALVFERRRDVSVTGVLGGTHGCPRAVPSSRAKSKRTARRRRSSDARSHVPAPRPLAWPRFACDRRGPNRPRERGSRVGRERDH